MSGFWFSEEQQAIRDAVLRLCEGFDAAYWRRTDESGEFPSAFVDAMTEAGWLGAAMPVDLGGSGLGLTEAAIVMQAVAESGAGFSGASAMHLNIFGPMPVVKFGSEAQRKAVIPRLISGQDRMCFAVTEPDAGLDTTNLTTNAVRSNDGYVISGRKMWTTNAQRANKVLIIARTTPKAQVTRPTEGLSLFYTDFDRSRITATPIPKMGRKAVESNAVFIDDLHVPADHLVGEEGRGFYYLLEGLNPERVLIAAEAVGLGRAALARAAVYARERVVFGRPIGQNQGVAHPLAKAWAELEAANLMAFERRQVPGRRSRLQRLRGCSHGPRRHGLRQGIPRGALLPGSHDRAYRSGQPRDDPELHRRAGPGPAQELLTRVQVPAGCWR